MYMGNIKKKNLLLIFFFFFFYLSCTCSKEFQYSKNLGSEAPSSLPHDHDHEMIKNQEGGGLMTTKMKMDTRRLKLKSRGKSSSDNWNRKRTYTAMLPKGYVPPSGSSPCHNTYPNSVTFFCHFSTTPNNKLP
ncbi:hypothetical protein KY290_014269 [Solanum tuberosum]|uniref:Uncharacterized protein n=1 Tax=Solanum tuberosum TaxID=4113 RepID=A0ABQ7VPD6_SOLTU|nr:hypothetical protein KY289_014330 [Solanum tuberosum]KAH0699453.1 hypothetical protein KY284_013668 [Solanum tuberosum]KAH0770288.1 hypothetical protein KY290_014269 [Solanum tuberosum]